MAIRAPDGANNSKRGFPLGDINSVHDKSFSPTTKFSYFLFKLKLIQAWRYFFLFPDSWSSFLFPQWTKTLASIAYWDTKDLPHTITTFCPTIHSKYKYRYQSPHYITQQIQIRVSKIPDINTVHFAATHNPEQKWIILSFAAQQCPSFDAEMKWLSEICLSFIRNLEPLHFFTHQTQMKIQVQIDLCTIWE